MMKISLLVLFMLAGYLILAQGILANDPVTYRVLNVSSNGMFIGRTNLYSYQLKIMSRDSAWSINIGTQSGGIRCFTFSANQQRIALGTYYGYVEIWEIATGKLLSNSRIDKSQINDVAFTPDDQFLIAASTTGAIRMLSADNLRTVKEIDGHSNVRCLEIIPGSDTTFIAGDHEGNITVWDNHGNKIHQWKAHASYVMDLKISNDGKSLYSAGHDKLIKKWNFNDQRLLNTFFGHTKAVFTIDYNPKSMQLVSGGMDNTVRLWNTQTGEQLRIYKGHRDYVMVTRFISDVNIVSGSRDFTLRLWKY